MDKATEKALQKIQKRKDMNNLEPLKHIKNLNTGSRVIQVTANAEISYLEPVDDRVEIEALVCRQFDLDPASVLKSTTVNTDFQSLVNLVLNYRDNQIAEYNKEPFIILKSIPNE